MVTNFTCMHDMHYLHVHALAKRLFVLCQYHTISREKRRFTQLKFVTWKFKWLHKMNGMF